MSDYTQTFLEIIHHAINRHPALAESVEKIAANAQGKGFGAATISQEVSCIQALLGTSPGLAIDIGGNVGDYTAELRAKFPGLEIHTFEPSSVNVGTLSRRFAGDSRITVVPLAVSDKAGPATLFSDKLGSGLGSLTQRQLDHLNIPFDSKETVNAVRFEDYWKTQLQRRPIDIVKLDIEGHELAALDGFGPALAVTRVLQFEFGGCNIDTRTYFKDFWRYFKDANFDLLRITPFGPTVIPSYRESDEFFFTTNYIAVNKRKF